MRRLGFLGFSALAMVACSVSSSDPAADPATAVSDVSPAQPAPNGGDCSVATKLVRCTSADPGVVAVVCGELEQDNTLDVRSGSLENGGCASPVAIGALAAQTDAHGIVDGGDRFAQVTAPVTATLACGRYRFSSWELDNTLALRIEGNVVIVVDGDVRIASPAEITLAEGARLDLVIAGDLVADNTFTTTGGSTWIGVGGDVRVASPVRIDGALVTPLGHIAADNTLDVGALYAGSLRVASPVTIRGASRVARDGCVGL